MDAAIVSPVMRYLGVADSDRTLTFYCDVLGFEVRSLPSGPEASVHFEVVAGPARIQFGAWDFPPGNWEDWRPPGSAIVFFETNDVEAVHAGVRARGGRPSELVK